MKAIRIHEHGDSSVLRYEDAPPPTLANDEVLIRVHAAGVNPVDWKTRAGRGVARNKEMSFPYIPGWDVSGVIEEIGSEANTFEVGDEVFGMLRFSELGSTYAEYTTAPTSQLALKPPALTHLEAAALPLVGLTAWQALFEKADLKSGHHILIHAAAGGVGHIAAQLARWKGAYVIGTASAHNKMFLHNLGVDQFINYTTTHFEDVLEYVDVVLDPIAGRTRKRSWQVLKAGGILVSVQGKPDTDVAAAHSVRSDFVLVQPNAGQLAQLCDLADVGHLKPHIDTVYPLRDAAQAHLHVEQGHTRGKVVLEV